MVCVGSLHQSVVKTTSALAPLLGFVVERLLVYNYVILRLADSLMLLPLTFMYVSIPCILLSRTIVVVSTNYVF
jgi:hypothetical protein